jgi:hypothetical protein
LSLLSKGFHSMIPFQTSSKLYLQRLQKIYASGNCPIYQNDLPANSYLFQLHLCFLHQ